METKRNMSEHDKQCTARLKTIWGQQKHILGLTQEKVALKAGWSSAAAFGAYLHGRIPMNLQAKFKIAQILEVDPKEIDPDMPVVLSDDLTDDEKQLLVSFGKLPARLKKAMLVQIRALANVDDLQNQAASH